MVAQDYLVTPIAELQGEASHTIHHHVTRHDLTHLRILVISVIFRPKRVIITKGGHHMTNMRSNRIQGYSNDLWIQNNDSM